MASSEIQELKHVAFSLPPSGEGNSERQQPQYGNFSLQPSRKRPNRRRPHPVCRLNHRSLPSGRTAKGQPTLGRARLTTTNLNKLYRTNEPNSSARAHFRNKTLLAIAEGAKTRIDMRISQVSGGRHQYVAHHPVERRNSVEAQLCHVDDDEPLATE